MLYMFLEDAEEGRAPTEIDEELKTLIAGFADYL